MSKFYYTIGEVSNLLQVKPYVIRYWETEFPQLKPRKGSHRNRQFTQENIDLLLRIKDMLYNQKFTIDGARQKLKQLKKQPEQTELDFLVKPVQPEPIQVNNTVKSQLLAELKEIKQCVATFSQKLKSLPRNEK